MRPNRLRLGAIAVWLGVIALGLNALVPIHLAFDLAHAAAPAARGDSGADHDFVRCLLSLVVGHHDDAEDRTRPDKSHHHGECAVCGAIANLAGLAPAAIVALAAPIPVYAVAPTAAKLDAPHAAPLAAYRSRAPPLA